MAKREAKHSKPPSAVANKPYICTSIPPYISRRDSINLSSVHTRTTNSHICTTQKHAPPQCNTYNDILNILEGPLLNWVP